MSMLPKGIQSLNPLSYRQDSKGRITSLVTDTVPVLESFRRIYRDELSLREFSKAWELPEIKSVCISGERDLPILSWNQGNIQRYYPSRFSYKLILEFKYDKPSKPKPLKNWKRRSK